MERDFRERDPDTGIYYMEGDGLFDVLKNIDKKRQLRR